MNDYIKREDAHVLLCQFCIGSEICTHEGVCNAEKALANIPVAVVREVVLCRDCKYYNTTGCADGYGWCEDRVVSTGVWDNFFCGRADMRPEPPKEET